MAKGPEGSMIFSTACSPHCEQTFSIGYLLLRLNKSCVRDRITPKQSYPALPQDLEAVRSECSMPVAWRASVKALAVRSPPSTRRWRRCRLWARWCTACARAAGFAGGTRRQLTPARQYSLDPPIPVAITGQPLAMASRGTSPKASCSILLVKRVTSACW